MSATSTVPTATPTAQAFEIRPLPGSVGAEIIGLDLSRRSTTKISRASTERIWTIM